MTDERGLTMLAPPSRVLSEHIAEQIRTAIVTDQLKAGQRIAEGEIAELMQTSRGPVREALLLLEKEGLVVRHPHRGTFVTRLSPEDIEEIYSLRQAIELLAVQYLITRASSANLDELETLVQQMADKIEEGVDPGDAAELDLAFHHALCRISGHRRALAAWEALSGQTRMLLLSRFKLRPQDFQQLAVEWHGRLVDALRQRDLPLAQEELSKHLGMTLKSVLHSGQEAE